MSGYVHTIKAEDGRTKKTGAFIHNGDGMSVSPVFDSVLALYGWMSRVGWECVEPQGPTMDLESQDFAVVRVPKVDPSTMN